MHSNALRYTRESRTIVFDNKGNISKVISDNSIQQYATYSKSNEILDELMLDREGFLDYRIYNGEPTERPLVLNQIIIVLNLYTIDAITYLNI